MNHPDNLLYTKDHEWVHIENGHAKIGITDYAQTELGDIVYVDIESLDEEIERHGIFGSVEAVKTVSDLFMPISGVVTEKNELLEDQPELVNLDPYGKGWMIKIKITGNAADADLLNVSEYIKEIGQ